MASLAVRHAEVYAAIAAGDTTLAEIAVRMGVTRQYIDQIVRKLPQTKQLDLDLALQANRIARNGVTAWGETKTREHWLRDPRCQVSGPTLRRRLDEGWVPEEAIAHPPTPGSVRPSREHPVPAEVAVQLGKLIDRARGVTFNMPADHPARVAALERDVLVRDLAAQGYSHRELARVAGVTIYAVRLWVRYAGQGRSRYKTQ
jgi:transcriptional regulator with XRE-family HTH domain